MTDKPLFPLMALLAIVTAACSTLVDGAEQPTTPDPSPVGTTTSSTSTTASDDNSPETLADFLGLDDALDPAVAEATRHDQTIRFEEMIRSCMAEEGFEYIPVIPPEDSYRVTGPEDEEERVHREGFGISTWYGSDNETGAVDSFTEWADPNQAVIDAMSEAERQAYHEAMFGTEEELMDGEVVTGVDPETGEEVQVTQGSQPGCYGEASELMFGGAMEAERLMFELSPELDELNQRIEADPRIVAWEKDWSACMAARGYDYTDRDDMRVRGFQDLQARFDEIVGSLDPFEGWSEEELQTFIDDHSDAEIEALQQQAEEAARAAVDEEALAALRQEEIDLAVADFECNAGFTDLYQEVAAEYEATFISENLEVLEQIRDAQDG